MNTESPRINESPARQLESTAREFSHSQEFPFTRTTTLGIAVDFGGVGIANIATRILARRVDGRRTTIVICNNHATADLYVSFGKNPIVGTGIFVKAAGGIVTLNDETWNDEVWAISAATWSYSGTEFYL